MTLDIRVGDHRCPSGAPVAILDDAGDMLSCFPAVADAIAARVILERDYQTTNDCDDPDDPDDPSEDPEDCCDGDPDGAYYREWVM